MRSSLVALIAFALPGTMLLAPQDPDYKYEWIDAARKQITIERPGVDGQEKGVVTAKEARIPFDGHKVQQCAGGRLPDAYNQARILAPLPEDDMRVSVQAFNRSHAHFGGALSHIAVPDPKTGLISFDTSASEGTQVLLLEDPRGFEYRPDGGVDKGSKKWSLPPNGVAIHFTRDASSGSGSGSKDRAAAAPISDGEYVVQIVPSIESLSALDGIGTLPVVRFESEGETLQPRFLAWAHGIERVALIAVLPYGEEHRDKTQTLNVRLGTLSTKIEIPPAIQASVPAKAKAGETVSIAYDAPPGSDAVLLHAPMTDANNAAATKAVDNAPKGEWKLRVDSDTWTMVRCAARPRWRPVSFEASAQVYESSGARVPGTPFHIIAVSPEMQAIVGPGPWLPLVPVSFGNLAHLGGMSSLTNLPAAITAVFGPNLLFSNSSGGGRTVLIAPPAGGGGGGGPSDPGDLSKFEVDPQHLEFEPFCLKQVSHEKTCSCHNKVVGYQSIPWQTDSNVCPPCKDGDHLKCQAYAQKWQTAKLNVVLENAEWFQIWTHPVYSVPDPNKAPPPGFRPAFRFGAAIQSTTLYKGNNQLTFNILFEPYDAKVYVEYVKLDWSYPEWDKENWNKNTQALPPIRWKPAQKGPIQLRGAVGTCANPLRHVQPWIGQPIVVLNVPQDGSVEVPLGGKALYRVQGNIVTRNVDPGGSVMMLAALAMGGGGTAKGELAAVQPAGSNVLVNMISVQAAVPNSVTLNAPAGDTVATVSEGTYLSANGPAGSLYALAGHDQFGKSFVDHPTQELATARDAQGRAVGRAMKFDADPNVTYTAIEAHDSTGTVRNRKSVRHINGVAVNVWIEPDTASQGQPIWFVLENLGAAIKAREHQAHGAPFDWWVKFFNQRNVTVAEKVKLPDNIRDLPQYRVQGVAGALPGQGGAEWNLEYKLKEADK